MPQEIYMYVIEIIIASKSGHQVRLKELQWQEWQEEMEEVLQQIN